MVQQTFRCQIQQYGKLTEISGDAKRCYEEESRIVGASQGGVSENMEELTRQGSSVEKTRSRINSWAEIHEDKWRRVQKKSK